MPRIDIPFPSESVPGKQPGEGGGVLFNAYVERQGEGRIWRRMPGLVKFAEMGFGPLRGLLEVGQTVYAIAGNRAMVIDRNGGVRLLDGHVEGVGPVSMARNNAPIPGIAVTSEIGNFLLTSLAVYAFPGGSVPQSNSVSFLDGYFLWTTPGGDCWASEINSNDVNALNFQRAEARPDGLLHGFVYQQQFYAAGPSSIEVYQNTGNPTGFPLTRSTVISVGIAGKNCVAGYEDGWDSEPIFVAADNTVRTLNGLRPQRVSNADIEADIAAVVDKDNLHASVFTFGGNAIWSLNAPEWTWQFNVSTGSWSRRESHKSKRWRGDISCRAFGKWLIGDLESTDLLAIDQNAMTEVGAPLIFGLDSGPVKQFPARMAVPDAFFDFTLGQGRVTGANPIETDPKVMLSWSHTGGATWGNPIEKSLGRQGRYVGPIRQSRMGLTSHAGIRFRWRVSDPVDAAFLGGRMDAQERRA